ncbi:hypothetical protein [Levilactobacillus fujinensis]|uniref:Uncharacterized protein n=1 Tax=Levilactobacillus fujinensis TaxID=2486024 RepID=A0ABW1TJD2_9LACO|nr:hypothetical protein [Levilactobacillus fujinensis]
MKVRDESASRKVTAYKCGQVFDTDGNVFWVITNGTGYLLIDVKENKVVGKANNLEDLFDQCHDSADSLMSAELLITNNFKSTDF